MSAAVVIRQKRWMRAFQDAGATSPEHARRPEECHGEPDWIFSRLVKKGVLVETVAGCYYLDEAVAQRLERSRRWLAAALLSFFLFIAVLSMLLES